MAHLNKVMLIGNVGKDAELRTSDNFKIASFSLATTTRPFKLKDGTEIKEATQWHNVITYNNLAEVCATYIKKGMSIFVEGMIKYESYDDSNGVKKYVTKVYADNIQFLSNNQTKLESENHQHVENDFKADDFVF